MLVGNTRPDSLAFVLCSQTPRVFSHSSMEYVDCSSVAERPQCDNQISCLHRAQAVDNIHSVDIRRKKAAMPAC